MYKIDLTKQTNRIYKSEYGWESKSINGESITFTNFSMLKNDIPFILVGGEIHPTRTDNNFWEESILKMKSGGINTITFYTHWLHIEKKPGVFDFSYNNNLHKFLLLCKKHHMYAIPRIGPFFNSEAAHGGLPSWLYGEPVEERTNDDRYLFYVERFYQALAEQFENLYFKDGGPIISIQLENEYEVAPALWDVFYKFGCDVVNKGDGGEEHMLILKKMAQKCGMDVPFFTCTGWGSPVPEGEILPTYGCYSYLGNCGPTSTSTFCEIKSEFKYPLAFSELGGGCPAQYAWRPIVPPESVEVAVFTRVACGGNITGIYMYHGGVNPENYERFYVSNLDMNLMSYDFYAPISEYGFIRQSYYQTKPIHHFLSDYGDLLGNMLPIYSEKYIEPENTEDLRYMCRANEDSGFIFINNFQDKLILPDRNDIKFEVTTSSGSFTVPHNHGINIQSGSMLILPLNMKVGSVHLIYATAQPIYKFENTLVFFEHSGTQVEFAFEGELEISGEVERECVDNVTYVYPKQIGLEFGFSVEGTNIIILNRYEATHSYKIFDEKLAVSENPILTFEDKIKVIGFNQENVKVKSMQSQSYDYFESKYKKADNINAKITKISEDKIVLFLDEQSFKDYNDIYMKICYDGDIARIFCDGLLIADNLNNGEAWYISLKRYKDYLCKKGLFIRLCPSKSEMSAYFDGITFHYSNKNTGDGVKLKSIEFIPEYYVEFNK